MTATEDQLHALAIAYPMYQIWSTTEHGRTIWYAARRDWYTARLDEKRLALNLAATVYSERDLLDLAFKLDEQMRDPDPAPNLRLMHGELS